LNLSYRSSAFNGHLSYAASLFLTLYNTFPTKAICPKRPTVLNGHYFFVPRVTTKDRFDCIVSFFLFYFFVDQISVGRYLTLTAARSLSGSDVVDADVATVTSAARGLKHQTSRGRLGEHGHLTLLPGRALRLLPRPDGRAQVAVCLEKEVLQSEI
jgi:hypothetical protein